MKYIKYLNQLKYKKENNINNEIPAFAGIKYNL